MNKCDLPALITALGGRQALQDLLGVGASAVSNYLARGELPRHAHAPVCAALESRGYHVDPGSLAIIGRGDGARHSRRRVLLIVGGVRSRVVIDSDLKAAELFESSRARNHTV